MAVPFIISYAGLHNPFYGAGYEITLIYIAAADIRQGTLKLYSVNYQEINLINKHGFTLLVRH